MIALEPCPFCGGEAFIEQYGDRRKSTIYLCENCGCRLETGEERNHGVRWNERSTNRKQLRLDQIEALAVCAGFVTPSPSTVKMLKQFTKLIEQAHGIESS